MTRRRTALASAVLGLLLAVTIGTGPAPAAGSRVVFTAGAAGAGDPYFPKAGNGGYDVAHYDLAVRYRPGLGRLYGRATIAATATQDLSRFDLDLDGLAVSSVLVDGVRATWRRSGGELVVTPAHGVVRGHTFTTVVRYAGVPRIQDDGSGFVRTADGAVVVGQPRVASTWFPANDHPVDKASYTFHITVPRALQAVANGRFTQRRLSGDWATWTWQATEPMASYLATATMGRFKLHSYSHDGIRLVDAIDPVLFRYGGSARSYGAVAEASFARHGQILDFLADSFGAFPFNASGGIVDEADLGFALETQTRPIYDPVFFTKQLEADSVVVHELAHQWFGDSLALTRWTDIWLNEGFAQYTEWLWSEHRGGATAQDIFDATYAAHPRTDSFWSLRIGDPGPDNLFHGAVYARGAMTMHQLRRTVGDTDFFAILRQWTASRGGGNVTIPQFVALAEAVSGQQLGDFFDAWLYTPGRPAVAAAGANAARAPARSAFVHLMDRSMRR